MVCMEYILNVFNRGVVNFAQITQMNFDVMCNEIEVFNVGLWGFDFMRAVVYK